MPDSLVTVLSAETFKIMQLLQVFSCFLTFLIKQTSQKVDFCEPSGAQTRNGLALIKNKSQKVDFFKPSGAQTRNGLGLKKGGPGKNMFLQFWKDSGPNSSCIFLMSRFKSTRVRGFVMSRLGGRVMKKKFGNR